MGVPFRCSRWSGIGRGRRAQPELLLAREREREREGEREGRVGLVGPVGCEAGSNELRFRRRDPVSAPACNVGSRTGAEDWQDARGGREWISVRMVQRMAISMLLADGGCWWRLSLPGRSCDAGQVVEGRRIWDDEVWGSSMKAGSRQQVPS